MINVKKYSCSRQIKYSCAVNYVNMHHRQSQEIHKIVEKELSLRQSPTFPNTNDVQSQILTLHQEFNSEICIY